MWVFKFIIIMEALLIMEEEQIQGLLFLEMNITTMIQVLIKKSRQMMQVTFSNFCKYHYFSFYFRFSHFCIRTCRPFKKDQFIIYIMLMEALILTISFCFINHMNFNKDFILNAPNYHYQSQIHKHKQPFSLVFYFYFDFLLY